MSTTAVSALSAVLFAALLVPLAFIPYVAWAYRRGSSGPGHALMTLSALLYGCALWTFTIVPLPELSDLICDGTVRIQGAPFAFVRDVGWGAGPSGFLRDAALRQVLMNVVLFVPFGMYARHLFHRSPRATVALGFLASLLIELTQITGNWWIYPCAYRLFDVDDLIANTSGAALGLLFVPLLRRVPGQTASGPRGPSPVRPLRRLMGMTVDLVLITLVGVGFSLAYRIFQHSTGTRVVGDATVIERLVPALAALVFAFIVPALGGATLGQRLVFLRWVRPDGSAPRLLQWAVRALAGLGGVMALQVWSWFDGPAALGTLTRTVAVATVLVATLINPRGLSGFASRLIIVDSRVDTRPERTSGQALDPRQLSVAVIGFIGALYLVGSLLLAVTAQSTEVGVGLAALGALALVLGSLVLLGYLAYTGVVVLRREGRSAGNALALLSAVAIVGLLVGLAVAVMAQVRWLGAIATAGLGATAYLGFLFAAFLVHGQLYARRDPAPGVDAIVVLGSRVFGDRVPPLLAARIDRGLALVNREIADGRAPLLVLSGGQGPDETMPEGEAMARYAVQHGADPAHVRAETASVNTEANLTLSGALLRQEGREGPVVVVTNDFHAFRAAIIAREVGLDAQVVGARTARYFFPSAVLREFVGVLARTPWLHAVALLVAVLLAGGVAWLVSGASLVSTGP